MNVRLITSPYADGIPLGVRLRELLEEQTFSEAMFVVAWARRSGLTRLADAVLGFRARGGIIRILLGIDEGGATREGLELARELANEAWVFHDPAGGTFHPKAYLVKGHSRAVAIVGSANLTLGGLYSNYECGIELDMALPADKGMLAGIEEWFDLLRSDDELCVELNDALLGTIVESGAARSEDDRETRSSDEREGPVVVLPFGKSNRRKVPKPAGTARPMSTRTAGPAARSKSKSPTVPAIDLRWFKRLPMSDAQRATGNVTGELRLTKSVLDIDWRTFFRRDLFGGREWRRRQVNGRPGEETTITFEVTIDGQYIGPRDLVISHAPHREQGQSNYTTVIHWGPLNELLRARDFTNYWAVISRVTDGRFALRIQRTRPS